VQLPPISTASQSFSIPPYNQSLPTSKPQKRKHDIIDEAPPEDLGRWNRKISKKAQGRNFDEKSGDEEKDEESGGRGGYIIIIITSRGKNGNGGASRGKNGKGGASRGKKHHDV
jgi:hypothetical protein